MVAVLSTPRGDIRFAGDGLRRLRERRGLKQSDVADRFGVSEGQIRNYESSRSALSVLQLPAYADALGVTPRELAAAIGLIEESGSLSGGLVVQLGDVRVVPIARGRVEGTALRWDFTGESVYVSATDADGHILIGMTVSDSIGELRDGDVAIIDGDMKYPPNGAVVVAHFVDSIEPFLAIYHAQGRVRVLYNGHDNTNMIPAQNVVIDGTVIGFHRRLAH